MTIRAVFLTIPIALFSFIASANEFKSNWIACVSEEAYDAYGEAMHADDRVGMAELKLKGLCINTDKLWGFQVVVAVVVALGCPETVVVGGAMVLVGAVPSNGLAVAVSPAVFAPPPPPPPPQAVRPKAAHKIEIANADAALNFTFNSLVS